MCSCLWLFAHVGWKLLILKLTISLNSFILSGFSVNFHHHKFKNYIIYHKTVFSKEDLQLVILDQVYFGYTIFFFSVRLVHFSFLKYCGLWFQLITFKVSHSSPYIVVKTQLFLMLSARGRSQNLEQLSVVFMEYNQIRLALLAFISTKRNKLWGHKC